MGSVEYYCQILGVSLGSSQEEIKRAYRQLAKNWHPDRFFDDLEKQKEAEQKFKQILEAYDFLKVYSLDSSAINFTTVNPNSGIRVQKDKPEIHYQQGVLYAEKQQYQEAIQEFNVAIKLDPSYFKAYQYRGFIFSKLGYNNRADADLRKATELKLKETFKTPETAPTDFYQHLKNNPASTDTDSYYSSSKSNSYWQYIGNLFDKPCSINCLTINENIQTIASGNNKGSIHLWRFEQLQPILTLQKHDQNVRCLLFDQQGKTLISGGDDKKIIIWDLVSQKSRILGNFKDQHTGAILSLSLSSDQQTLVSGSADKTVKIWMLNSQYEPYTLTGYADAVFQVIINPTKPIFASGNREKNIRIRSLETGKIIRSIPTESGVNSLAFSANGKILVAGCPDHNIRLWDVDSGELMTIFQGHLDQITSLNFSADDQFLISGSWDKTIKIWSIEQQKILQTLSEPCDKIEVIAIYKNAQVIIGANANGKITIWKK